MEVRKLAAMLVVVSIWGERRQENRGKYEGEQWFKQGWEPGKARTEVNQSKGNTQKPYADLLLHTPIRI